MGLTRFMGLMEIRKLVKRDGAYTRSERLRQIRSFIGSLKDVVPYKKTFAALMMKHGLKKDTLREYLEVIEFLGEVDIDETANTLKPIHHEEA